MKPQGLVEWLRFITRLQKWIAQCPPDLKRPDHIYEVEDVAYKDLAALSQHYNVLRRAEDYAHRQSVHVDLSDDISVTFYSPPRPFTYDDIHVII